MSIGSALRSASFVVYDCIFPILSEAASNQVDMKMNSSFVSRLLVDVARCCEEEENEMRRKCDGVLDIFVGGLFGIDMVKNIRDEPRHGLFTKRRAMLTQLELQEEQNEKKEEKKKKIQENITKTTTTTGRFSEGDIVLYTNESRGIVNAEVKIMKVHNDAGGHTYFEIRLPDGKIIGTISQKLQPLVSSNNSRVVDYKATLTKFYSVHVPEKIKDVKHLLQKYRGAEKDLVEALVNKYGRPVPLIFREDKSEEKKQDEEEKVVVKKEELEKKKRQLRYEMRKRRRRRIRKNQRLQVNHSLLEKDDSKQILGNLFCNLSSSKEKKKIYDSLKSVLKDPKDQQEVSTLLKDELIVFENNITKIDDDTKVEMWNELLDLILKNYKDEDDEKKKKNVRTIEESLEYINRVQKLFTFANKHADSKNIASLIYGPHSCRVCEFLCFPVSSIQRLVYTFILRAVSEFDSNCNDEDDDDDGEKKIQDIQVNKVIPLGILAMLRGEKSRLNSHDWYAYILSWNVLSSVFGKISLSSQNKSILASCLKTEKHLERILELCVSQICDTNTKSHVWPYLSPGFTYDKNLWFDLGALPFPHDQESADLLHRSTMMHTAARVPALFRDWWNARDFSNKRERVYVEKFITEKISPLCVDSEMLNIAIGVASKRWDVDQISIRGSRIPRTICASYQTEEWSLEILLELPQNYPLLVPRIESSRRFGIEEDRMRRWIVQIRSVISGQNASLLDAILLWKENVDLEFNGMDPCPICYSVVHVTRHTLPRLVCSTCSKKFHSDCLYKWFTTSQKSACPLCRQPF